ncbi:hypothetical protein H0N99_03530 [Candidatus Micrarchaeota archaeon]|nr:hypothetical protein [Candidatus Micrarchaeota archaeon]
MNWKSIKPDIRVVAVFIILFVISLLASSVIRGDSGYLSSYHYKPSSCKNPAFEGVRCWYEGLGLPFQWTLTLGHCDDCCKEVNESVVKCNAGGVGLPIGFEPVNFILDAIIWWVVAFLLVKSYDFLFKRKKK